MQFRDRLAHREVAQSWCVVPELNLFFVLLSPVLNSVSSSLNSKMTDLH